MHASILAPRSLRTLRTDGAPAPDRAPAPRPSTLSLLTRVRVLVLAFAILAAGFAALGPQLAQEASAVSPCTVSSAVKVGVSNGAYYVYGQGTVRCPSEVYLEMRVDFYANGVWVATKNTGGMRTSQTVNTGSVWGKCGVRYQTATTHTMNSSRSTTWSAGYYLC